MISNFKVAFVECEDVAESLRDQFERIILVNSMSELKKNIVENSIDLIVYGPNLNLEIISQKIFKQYKIPGVSLSQYKNGQEQILASCNKKNLIKKIKEFKVEIMSLKHLRENVEYKYLLENLKQFTNQIVHTTKDLFVAETKKYFCDTIKLNGCYWVQVKEGTLNLPPILKLRQELEKQKVDQSTLINELNECHLEVVTCDDFQIWKSQEEKYLALLWVKGPEGSSQCLVLSGLKTDNLNLTQTLISTLMPFLIRRWNLCLTVENANKEIYKDSLTDLYNQKFLNEVLDKKIEECNRYKTPFSVLFIDIDYFKKVNDSLGHLVGSGVLTQMGVILKDLIRNSDYAFRYGGDEFIILLGHTEGQDAVNVAERIRKKVENHPFNVNKVPVRITVSIGLAFYPKHANSAEEIVRIADEAMYYGKNKSRNIVYKAG